MNQSMSQPELIKIARYLQGLEEDLMEQDIQYNSMKYELVKLHKIIKQLMEASAAETTSEGRTALAGVEYKARKCREKMLERTAVEN